MRDLRRLLFYLKPHRGKFALATVAMLAVGLLQSAIGALIVPIFDQALRETGSTGERTPTLFGLQHFIPDSGFAAWRTIAILLIVFSVAKGVAEYFSTYLMARVGQGSVVCLREDMYTHLHAQSADFFERHRTNYLVSRLVSSTAAIETAVSHTLRDMLRESFTLIFFLSASFYYSWRLTLGSLIIAPVIALLTARFGRSLRNLARESFEGGQRLVDTAQEALASHNIVKAYVAEEHERGRFSLVAQQIMRANLRTAKINGVAPPTIEMIGVIAVAVLLFFAQREIFAGRMDAEHFIAFLFFLFSSYDPMRKLSRLNNGLEQALAAARHVWEVMDEHAEMSEKADAVTLQPLREAIELRHVNFRYGNEERQVLRDISLRIPAGQMVALVGESGGGKSTLTKLIPRFHDPAEGSVLWDGVDLRDARVHSLRSNIALVTQETILFNDSVRYNISYSRPAATETEIEEARASPARTNSSWSCPRAMTPSSASAAFSLSAGAPALAIARAVLAGASVLVLDEATRRSYESERLVQKASPPDGGAPPSPSPTVSRPVRRADLIVVMERGRISEMGSTRSCSRRTLLPKALRTAIRRRRGGIS